MTADAGSATTMPCRACRHDVPAGKFCGRCGARLTPEPGDGPSWLRIGDYAAAPGEHVLQPSIVSSVFPHLPERSQGAFRVGLLFVVVVLAAFAVLGWQVPLVAAAILAPVLLFAIYVVETGVIGDLPPRIWVLTTVAALGIGVGWALATSSIFAQSYAASLGAQAPDATLILKALMIPFGGVVVMQLATVLVWFTRPRHHAEALDGFAVGILGATLFAVAANATRLVPQLRAGVLTQAQPLQDLLIGGAVLGVTAPLTAAAFGGLVGAGLWLAAGRGGRHRRRLLACIAAVLVTFAVAYAGVGLSELLALPLLLQFSVHAAVALAAVIALRIGVQLALLHERDGDTHPELPILCPHCGHVVPDMTFCPACGVAAHASSRVSRAARRRDRPRPSGQAVQR